MPFGLLRLRCSARGHNHYVPLGGDLIWEACGRVPAAPAALQRAGREYPGRAAGVRHGKRWGSADEALLHAGATRGNKEKSGTFVLIFGPGEPRAQL